MSDYHPNSRAGFIENTLEGLRFTMERAVYAENVAFRRGLLQRIDPRVKVAGVFALIVAVALSMKLWPIAVMIGLAIFLGLASHIPFWAVGRRAWMGVLLFTGMIAVPALFLTPGAPFRGLPITITGLRTAGFLILRAEAAATLMLVLVYSTPWTHVLKALRVFRVPVIFVVILGMTCRYILLMLETAHQIFESRQSRTVNKMLPADHRRLAVSTTGVLLGRTIQMSGDIYLAMQARGFRGEVYLLDEFEMRQFDWLALGAFALAAGFAVWVGR